MGLKGPERTASRPLGQARDPDQRLEVRPDDMGMRQSMAVGVHTETDGAEALQGRHSTMISAHDRRNRLSRSFKRGLGPRCLLRGIHRSHLVVVPSIHALPLLTTGEAHGTTIGSSREVPVDKLLTHLLFGG